MDYLIAKWLHVLSSTLLFGPGIGSAYHMLCASLTRQPARKLRSGARGPAAGARAARQHLLARGGAAHRVEAATASAGDGVQLRLSLPSAAGAISRDGGAPVSAPLQSH